MAEKTITFHFQHPTFRLRHRSHIRAWLDRCASMDGHKLHGIHYQFCTDGYMLEANRQFLAHDYLTDILTFPMPSAAGIAGDILISIDRVRDNAKTLNHNTLDELHRVMAHGVLHLLGHNDATDEEQSTMRHQEDRWLDHRAFP